MSQSDRRLTYRLRRVVGPWVNRAVRTVTDQEIRVHPSGYVGTVQGDIDRLESLLSDAGFPWNPVSMYHYTRLGNQTNGSWVYRASPFASRQLHAVLVRRGPDRIDVYAHREFNWRRHPLKHARDAGLDREDGADRMGPVLDQLDVEYADQSYVRRKVDNASRRLRSLVAERTPL